MALATGPAGWRCFTLRPTLARTAHGLPTRGKGKADAAHFASPRRDELRPFCRFANGPDFGSAQGGEQAGHAN